MQAIALENAWKTECLRTHVNANNPKYMEIQGNFVLQKAESSDFNSYFSVWEHYKDALSLSHVMSRLEIREKFFSWCNRNVNFLMDGFQPQQALTQMHNLSLMILGNMRKYWDKKIQSIVMYEALKFCVGGPSSTDVKVGHESRFLFFWIHISIFLLLKRTGSQRFGSMNMNSNGILDIDIKTKQKYFNMTFTNEIDTCSCSCWRDSAGGTDWVSQFKHFQTTE